MTSATKLTLEKISVLVSYDIRAAFDQVDDDVLIERLEYLEGLSGTEIKCRHSSNHFVSIGNCISN